MRYERSFVLSFTVVIFSGILVCANENSYSDPTIRQNQEETTEELRIAPSVKESWKVLENDVQATTNSSNQSPSTIPSENGKQSIDDESSSLPKHRIADRTIERDPVLLEAKTETEPESRSETKAEIETEPTDPSSLIREQRQCCSCKVEVSEFIHDRETGAIVHEIFCEADKLFHYVLIAAENLMYELGFDEQLFDANSQQNHLIWLLNLLSDKSLFEVVEYCLKSFEKFLSNPEYLDYLSVVFQNSVPVDDILQTWNRLEIAVNNFVGRIVELVDSHLDINADVVNDLREETVGADTLRFVREYSPNHFVGKPFSLEKTVSFVESLFDQFHDHESFLGFFDILKKLVHTLRDFSHGFHVSGFHKRVVAPVRNLISSLLSSIQTNPLTDGILSDGKGLFNAIFNPSTNILDESSSPIRNGIIDSSKIAQAFLLPNKMSSPLQTARNFPTDLFSPADRSRSIFPFSQLGTMTYNNNGGDDAYNNDDDNNNKLTRRNAIIMRSKKATNDNLAFQKALLKIPEYLSRPDESFKMDSSSYSPRFDWSPLAMLPSRVQSVSVPFDSLTTGGYRATVPRTSSAYVAKSAGIQPESVFPFAAQENSNYYTPPLPYFYSRNSHPDYQSRTYATI